MKDAETGRRGDTGTRHERLFAVSPCVPFPCLLLHYSIHFDNPASAIPSNITFFIPL